MKTMNSDCNSVLSGYLHNPSIADYYNVAADSIAASDIGRFGSCGVGIREGPRITTFSAPLGKTFHLTERLGIHYEARFANLFNTDDWGIPDTNVGSSSFGEITSQQDATAGSQAGLDSFTCLFA